MTLTAEMIREAEAHLPSSVKNPPERWAWMADYLNESMASPGKVCPCCNVSRDGADDKTTAVNSATEEIARALTAKSAAGMSTASLPKRS